MAEILSQSQIDMLLKGINSGEVPMEETPPGERKTKDYDFKSPKKFTKEQLRTMDSLHENFARLFASYLSGVLRVACDVEVAQIEEQRYYEYNNALPSTALMGMVELKPTDANIDEATCIIDMSTTIAFYMIDRLLGGSGDSYNINREFTDIEIAIVENIYRKVCTYIQEAWISYLSNTTSLRSVETNPRLIQVYSPEDIVVIVSMEVKIEDIRGSLSICIPAINLEELMGNFTSKYARIVKKHDPNKDAVRKSVIMESVKNSDLEMKAVLDETAIDVHDVLRLKVDDVIPLNKKINSDILITVDDIPWFGAKLGQTNLKKAIKINSLI